MKWKLYLLTLLFIFALAGCESEPQNLPEDEVHNKQPSKEPDSVIITSTPEPTVTEKPIVIEEKEIVFANHFVYRHGRLYSEKFNVIESVYEPENAETIYAFCIDFENFLSWECETTKDYPIAKDNETREEWWIRKNDFWTKEVLEVIEDTDLILLSDYPYCHYNQKKLTHPYHHSQTLRLGLCAVAGTVDEIKKLFDNTSSFDGLCLLVRKAPRPDLLDKMKEAGWNGFSPQTWFEQHEEKIRQFIGNEQEVTQIVKIKTEIN